MTKPTLIDDSPRADEHSPVASAVVHAEKIVPTGKADHVIVGLELMRGLACLEVVGSHILWSDPAVEGNRLYYHFFRWGYQAVMIFFVLSGLVIARAQMRNHRTPGRYLVARFERIVPLYLVAIVFSVLVSLYVRQAVEFFGVLAHLFFMQAAPSEISPFKIHVNPALWSLSCEMWFYLFYAVVIHRSALSAQTKLVAWAIPAMIACLAVHWFPMHFSILEHFIYILALSSVWLLGVILASFERGIRCSFAQAIAFFLMIPVIAACQWGNGRSDVVMSLADGLVICPLLLVLASPQKSTGGRGVWFLIAGLYAIFALYAQVRGMHDIYGFKAYMIVTGIVGAVIAMVVERRVPRVSEWPRALVWTILGLGQISYAVYIIHQPIIWLALKFGIKGHPTWWLLVAPLILAIGAAMEYGLQPLARNAVRRLFPPSRANSA